MPAMSDTHERPALSRNIEQDHPYAGLEQFWNFEVERRRHQKLSHTKLMVGLSASVGTMFLLTLALNGLMNAFIPFFAVVLLIAAITILPPLWLTWQGIRGLAESRELPPPQSYRAIRGDQQDAKRVDQSAQRQLLEAIERNGELTPTKAALQTSLTVDEAEQLLSDLAQRGHLDVRVEGSKLVYAL